MKLKQLREHAAGHHVVVMQPDSIIELVQDINEQLAAASADPSPETLRETHLTRVESLAATAVDRLVKLEEEVAALRKWVDALNAWRLRQPHFYAGL